MFVVDAESKCKTIHSTFDIVVIIINVGNLLPCMCVHIHNWIRNIGKFLLRAGACIFQMVKCSRLFGIEKVDNFKKLREENCSQF